MKKKEVLRRLSAVSMAAMMTVTMVPSNAFAAEEIFSDTDLEVSADAETEETSATGESDISDTSEADIEVEEETPETEDGDISGEVETDTEESGDSDEVDVFSDDEDTTEDILTDAGEGTAAADAVVHMTLSVADQLASAKDGTLMVDRDVTVKDIDGNGILTYDEALVAAHNEYYEGGATAGYASEESQYGLGVKKLWGEETSAVGYWNNDASCLSLADPVKADDYLNAFVYKDKDTWSDAYTKFDKKNYEATAGMPLTVSVQKAGYDTATNQTVFTAYEGSILTAYDSSYKALAKEDYTVDGYKVTFNKAGTYYLATGGTDSVNLVPAVAKITVKDKTEEKSYLKSLRLASVERYVAGQAEYTCTLGANKEDLYIGATLSEDAPEGSTIIAKYTNVRSNPPSEETRTVSRSTRLAYVAKEGLTPATFTITVGKDDDVQVYTVHIDRTVYMSETFTTAEGSTIPELDNTLYLMDDDTKSINITVKGYDAKIDVNGTPVESDQKYAFTPTFDDKGECKILITGTGNGDKVTKEYILKHYKEEELISGTQKTITWTLKDGVLTLSGTGKSESYNAGWKVFKNKITSVIVEEGVTELGSRLFADYTSIKSVTLPKGLSCSTAFTGCTGLETATIGSIGSNLFNGCTSLKEVIMDSIDSIPSNVFNGCRSLESFVIPDGVKNIEAAAFRDCTSLRSITIPESVETISTGAFQGCSSLKSVTVPEGVKTVSSNAFTDCTSLKEIKLPSTMVSLAGSAFSGCTSLKTISISGDNFVVLDNGVYTADMKTMVLCKPTCKGTVTVPEGVTKIQASAFTNCKKVTEVIFPDGLTTIGNGAFWDATSLKKVTIPDTVSSIESNAFRNCTLLTEVKLPAALTQVASFAFWNCTGMERVVIPEGVTSIGGNAFGNMQKTLKFVAYGGTPEQWQAISGGTNKPAAPAFSTVIIYGAKSFGDPADAPVILEQPQDQGLAIGEDAKDVLKIKAADLKENEKYYLSWYTNTERDTVGATLITGNTSENGTESTATPATDTRKISYYYCLVQKVDAKGAATWTYSDIITVAVGADLFEKGSGTKNKPYELSTADDLVKLKQLVKDGNNMKNTYFQMTADITLPEGWTPIGETIDGTNDIQKGKNLHAFSGIFDGNNKTLTVPEGGLPLFGYVKEAEIKNLNIYGKKIAGAGLVNNFEGVGLSGTAAVIDNVTLKSGSSTLRSGLLNAEPSTNGYAANSAGFTADVRNCTIEKDVVIGYSKEYRFVGSIAGRMQGYVKNCVSYATVYGVSWVGGIIGARDNALGDCIVTDCSFHGTVEASATHAGGIVGGGYENSSAPNGIHGTINNCVSTGTIIGEDRVGGILGADSFTAQAWNAYTMKGNSFTGKVQVTGENASYIGGIIGFYDSLNKFDDIANNYYSKDCGAEKGIGFVKYVDTNCATHETESGAVYFNTEKDTKGCPTVAGCNWKPQHNRTDDPLGADANKLTNTEGVKKYAEKLEISGDYSTDFYLGDDLDFTGMEIEAQMSDGEIRELTPADLEITGYNKDKRGQQAVTLSYEGATEIIIVTVLKKDPEDITVSFELLGDKIHNSAEDENPHTLRAGNLETWIENKEYEVDGNATVLDVMAEVLTSNRYKWENPKGNYVSSITKADGTKLAEFTNGQNSGWMYTLNGVHSDLGVAEQYLEDGDIIVFHYTDDYTLEHDHIWGSTWSTDENAHWHECTYPNSECDITDNTKKAGYGEHTFDEGKVTKAATCTAEGVKTYTCTVCGYEKTEKIPADGHKFGNWKTVTEATVFAPKKEERSCSNCDQKETRNSGSKLTATIKLNAKSIKLQKKQKTTKIKVTGLANGDSVKSWTSSNKKVVTVNNNGVIKAGKKTGKATITVTLASGTKATLKVKVQKARVKTTKIAGLDKKVTLKKGQKLTLNPVLSPITTQDKVTYVSSKKKVATVNKKGVVTAKKKGTTKITVKSGNKKYTITVKVK